MNPSNEPVMTGAAIAGLASVLMGTLVAFGVPLTEAQRDAVKDLVLVGFPIVAFLIAAIIARSKVIPVAKVEDTPGGKAVLERAG